MTSKERNKALVELARLKRKLPQTKADSPERAVLLQQINQMEKALR